MGKKVFTKIVLWYVYAYNLNCAIITDMKAYIQVKADIQKGFT
jgi:hypothetical protein